MRRSKSRSSAHDIARCWKYFPLAKLTTGSLARQAITTLCDHGRAGDSLVPIERRAAHPDPARVGDTAVTPEGGGVEHRSVHQREQDVERESRVV